MEFRAHAVEHLKFEPVAPDLAFAHERLDGGDDALVVRREPRIPSAFQQRFCFAQVGAANRRHVAVRQRRRFGVGAFAEPYASAARDHAFDVVRRSFEVGLEHRPHVRVLGLGALEHAQGRIDDRRAFHVDPDEGISVSRRQPHDLAQILECKLFVKEQAHRRQLQRDVCVDAALPDRRQERNVGLPSPLRLCACGHVFAEEIKRGTHPGGVEANDRGHRIVHGFPSNEAFGEEKETMLKSWCLDYVKDRHERTTSLVDADGPRGMNTIHGGFPALHALYADT